jgi:hypothetical protein
MCSHVFVLKLSHVLSFLKSELLVMCQLRVAWLPESLEETRLNRERFLCSSFVPLPRLFSVIYQRHDVNGLSPQLPSFGHSSQYYASQSII